MSVFLVLPGGKGAAGEEDTDEEEKFPPGALDYVDPKPVHLLDYDSDEQSEVPRTNSDTSDKPQQAPETTFDPYYSKPPDPDTKGALFLTKGTPKYQGRFARTSALLNTLARDLRAEYERKRVEHVTLIRELRQTQWNIWMISPEYLVSMFCEANSLPTKDVLLKRAAALQDVRLEAALRQNLRHEANLLTKREKLEEELETLSVSLEDTQTLQLARDCERGRTAGFPQTWFDEMWDPEVTEGLGVYARLKMVHLNEMLELYGDEDDEAPPKKK